MVNLKINQLSKNPPLLAYCFSTLFIVFFSVNAIQNWPDLWAKTAITLSCIIPSFFVLKKVKLVLLQTNPLPTEIKFSLIIIVLGILNICLSEDSWASLKGMGLFLMSGIIVFIITFFIPI